MPFRNSPAIKKFFAFLLVGIFAGGIGLFLRLYPLLHHVSSDSSEKATVLVLSNLRVKIASSIKKNFPNLTPLERNRLVKDNFDDILRKERDNLQKTIEKTARAIDKQQGYPQPHPYLLASDSYYYYGLTENIVETGKMSDTIKGSKYLNKLMLAPQGHWEPLTLHPYVGYYLYRILSLFQPDISLAYAVSLTPLVITLLALIPLLAICAMSQAGPLSSLVSAVLFLLSPIFLKRTSFGWYDNDPYNIFFPLLILAVLFYSLRQLSHRRNTVILAVICSALMTLYSLFWQGWVFFLSVIFISWIGIILYNRFVARDPAWRGNDLLFPAVMVAMTFLGIAFVFGTQEFFILFQEGWKAINDFLTPKLSAWPDLYLSVGELKKTPFALLVELAGGIFFFSCAVLGLALSFLKPKEQSEKWLPAQAIILGVFLSASLFMGLGALRFVLFCLVPLALLCPIGLKFLSDRAQRHLAKMIPSPLYRSRLSSAAVWCIVILLLIPFIRQRGKNMPNIVNKIFNSTWERVLIKIKEETPSDSIINTWWPPGHFIKAVAKRRVTFDGATINNPQGYWLSYIFLCPDERQAAGLLRMLNNSANQSAEYLQGIGIKTSTSVDTLKKIAGLDQEKARQYLKRNLPLTEKQTEDLLKLTHRPPPPSYLMIYNECIEKNMEFKFIGGRNFKKIEDINSSPAALKDIPSPHSPNYI
ncbi:MAG: STT3 domain-containing protein, partial [Candidatus Omnitrophota bacterium]